LKTSTLQNGVLVLAILLGAGTWYYLYGVFLPYHEPLGINRANRFDLYPRWLGTRELVLHGRNPYSLEVTREIQLGYYGRIVEPGEDEQRFAYPLYIVFFLAPTVTLPFSVVNTACAVLLLALTIASILVSIRALSLKLSAHAKILAIVLVLGSWPVALGLYERQLSLVVAFLLAMAGMGIARGRLRVAGLCLACAMIKPQLSVPLTAWLLVWVSGSWQERKSLFLSFIATTGILLFGAEFALPHWFANWWHSLPAYLSYTGSKSSLERLFGSVPGFVVALLLIAAVATMGWKLRKHPAQSERFGFAFCLVLSITLILIPTFSLASYNEVLLMPAVLWICSAWKHSALPRKRILVWILAALALAWEPVSACTLAIASWFPGFVATENLLRIPVGLYFLMPAIIAATMVVVARNATGSGADVNDSSAR
jgi:hypothetical protein